jgi:hypothetical protein
MFMRALPRIMAERPRTLRDRGLGAAYGLPSPRGSNWKSVFLNEVESRIDLGRLHFVGHLPYTEYLKLLQISSAQFTSPIPLFSRGPFLRR